jgi:5'-deoxynucleotidase YfbR-like HD superfamily hydrolase
MSSIVGKLRDIEDQQSKDGTLLVAKIKHYRRGNKVKRYHTVDCHVQETVGHHSANVAILCTIISEQPPSVPLLMAALTHDTTEQFTGDVPATAKWDSPELAAALKKMEERLTRNHYDTLLKHHEKRVLKQADMLDLCFKALEEVKMGNQEFGHILRRGLDYLRTNDPLPTTQLIMKEIHYEFCE